jgi:sugar O-acyltransferase (sialic acid O-acetyltransferase NeuD family)
MEDVSASRCVVFGAGGHGRVAADVARAAGFVVAAFLDDAPRPAVDGVPVVEAARFEARPGDVVVLGIGDSKSRRAVFQRMLARGVEVVTVVHPSAVVSASATLGPGTVVMPRVVVNAGASIGIGVILNSGCIVEHDCVLGDFLHVAPRAALGGAVRVGDDAHVGLGACVLQSLASGAGALVGAGAVVIDDVRDGDTVVGNPARVLPPRVGRSPTRSRIVRFPAGVAGRTSTTAVHDRPL